jgi:hypothetical protein
MTPVLLGLAIAFIIGAFVLILLIDFLWQSGNDANVPQHVHSTPEEDEFRQAEPLRARLERD